MALSEMQDIFERQHKASRNEPPADAKTRIERIDRAIALLVDNADDIADALNADFGSRARETSLAADVVTPLASLKYCRKHVRRWMKRDNRQVSFPFNLLGTRAYVDYQPLGCVGIVSPWNFPFALALSPIAGVLAAGNRAMIKPSELAPHSSDLMKALVSNAFDVEEVAVVTGGVDVGTAFTGLPFDHLVFTGSDTIARHVMRSAADNLTPVTLELGGKSPVIISRNADLDLAATRIANGKLLNSGQVCLSPDYVFVPDDMKEALVDKVEAAMTRFYPTLSDNADYTAIIASRHRDRLHSLVDDAQKKGAVVRVINPARETFDGNGSTKLAPHIVTDVSDDMAIMQEEIFGPLLPVKTYDRIEQVIEHINARPRPLGLYYFGSTRDGDFGKVSERVVCGGITVNDVGVHAMQEDLPFGGVGTSGMGRYHGKEGFLAFSHHRSVYCQTRLKALSVMFPPYNQLFRKALQSMITK